MYVSVYMYLFNIQRSREVEIQRYRGIEVQKGGYCKYQYDYSGYLYLEQLFQSMTEEHQGKLPGAPVDMEYDKIVGTTVQSTGHISKHPTQPLHNIYNPYRFTCSRIHIFTYSHIHIFTYSHIPIFTYSRIHIQKLIYDLDKPPQVYLILHL